MALYAESDLSFVVTLFALSRLGSKALTMSVRLSAASCLALLERTGCDTVLYGGTPRITSIITEVAAARPDIELMPTLQRSNFDKPDVAPQPPFERPISDPELEQAQLVVLMHSSGSTGFPKPLYLSHRSSTTSSAVQA